MKALFIIMAFVFLFPVQSLAQQNNSGYTKSYKGYSSESRRGKRKEQDIRLEKLKTECEDPKKSFLPKCRSLKKKLEEAEKNE